MTTRTLVQPEQQALTSLRAGATIREAAEGSGLEPKAVVEALLRQWRSGTGEPAPVAKVSSIPLHEQHLEHPKASIRRLAVRIRDDIVRLKSELEADQAEAELRAEEQRLREALAAVLAKRGKRRAHLAPKDMGANLARFRAQQAERLQALGFTASEVRAWGKAHGYKTRGSILSRALLDAYTAAHGGAG